MTRAPVPFKAPIRVALTDGRGPWSKFSLPQQKTLLFALVTGAMCVAFAIPWISMIRKMAGHRTDTVANFTGLLFEGFWALGWSVGVLGLFALTLVLSLYRDEYRAGAGKLAFVAWGGPLRLFAEYELARVSNVRTESQGEKGLAHIRFDYGDANVTFGRPLPSEVADEGVEFIRQALAVTGTYAAEPPEAVRAAAFVSEESSASPRETVSSAGWLPVAFLVGANLVPLVGVLLFDWDLAQIMVLFWTENAIVGFYTLLKLAVIVRWGALLLGPFFVGHFGAFMAGHLMFVYYLFVRGFTTKGPEPNASTALFALFAPLWIAILSIFASHGVSFFSNFLGRREYLERTGSQQMAEPYRRLMVLHVTLIFGGWAVMALGQPVYALLFLVVLKIAIDLYAHLREHRASD